MSDNGPPKTTLDKLLLQVDIYLQGVIHLRVVPVRVVHMHNQAEPAGVTFGGVVTQRRIQVLFLFLSLSWFFELKKMFCQY